MLKRIRRELAADPSRRRKLEVLRELRRWNRRTPEADACESSLHAFVRHAWPIVEPRMAFLDNWHIRAICEHLEYATRTPHYKLLINVPPGCMKSLLVAVFWPCWVWGPAGWPESRWLFASYSADLSTRDSLRCREILESDWYRRNWGHRVRLAGDANLKTYFANTAGGWRMATSVGGRGTGEHPDFRVWDDPHKVTEAESDVERENVLRWRDGTLA
ncbi:MAG: terminase, partial [Planctomycetes bacterium]|nr:terminase [Planctomycetota bacterium]